MRTCAASQYFREAAARFARPQLLPGTQPLVQAYHPLPCVVLSRIPSQSCMAPAILSGLPLSADSLCQMSLCKLTRMRLELVAGREVAVRAIFLLKELLLFFVACFLLAIAASSLHLPFAREQS